MSAAPFPRRETTRGTSAAHSSSITTTTWWQQRSATSRSSRSIDCAAASSPSDVKPLPRGVRQRPRAGLRVLRPRGIIAITMVLKTSSSPGDRACALLISLARPARALEADGLGPGARPRPMRSTAGLVVGSSSPVRVEGRAGQRPAEIRRLSARQVGASRSRRLTPVLRAASGSSGA